MSQEAKTDNGTIREKKMNENNADEENSNTKNINAEDAKTKVTDIKEEDSKTENTRNKTTDINSESAVPVNTTVEDMKKITSKKNSMIIEIISWIKWIVFVIAFTFVLRYFVIINADIPSTSMYPLIIGNHNNPDRIIGFRLAYLLENPKRKDVIIFKYPVDETSAPFIKRVIGLPGEKVTIKDGKVYINNAKKPLKEPYINGTWTVENTGFTFQVPKDCYLVLGDNRNVSMDARYWASEALNRGLAKTNEEAQKYSYVKKSQILGKAEFAYWPSVKWMN